MTLPCTEASIRERIEQTVPHPGIIFNIGSQKKDVTPSNTDKSGAIVRSRVHETASSDLGRVDSSLPMERIMLLLQPSAEQEAALANLLNYQSDKDSEIFLIAFAA
jgi:hypothetical protein